MKNADIKAISYYIYSTFNDERKLLLENYIISVVDEIHSNFSHIAVDDIFDTICDPKTDDFETFVTFLNEIIDNDSPMNHIQLTTEEPNIWIECTELGKECNPDFIKDFVDFLKNLEKKGKMVKGNIYEYVCANFLTDMGIKSTPTKLVGDKGIDIQGSYKVNIPEKLHEFFINDDIYILAQAKFFNKEIDTPVIRKLVGDSLFIRFSQLDYVDISHNAVHLFVFSHKGFSKSALKFAKENKVITMNSMNIIRLLSKKDDPYNSYTWKYIEESMKSINK